MNMLLAQNTQAQFLFVCCVLAIPPAITIAPPPHSVAEMEYIMANKKNTTATNNTATVTAEVTQQTSAPAEKKNQRKNTSGKAGKTATKKDSKKAPAHSYDAEKNSFTLLVPKAKRDELGQLETSLKEISYLVPKTVKADQRTNFVDLIQAQILDSLESESNLKVSQINEKVKKSEDGQPTPKQSAKLEELKALKKLVTATRTRLKLKNAIYDEFAYLIACDVLNKPVNIELGSVKVALIETSAELDTVLLAFMNGESVTITADQQAILTACKDKIKGALERYTKETTWCDAFKLGISNKDILSFYKLGFSGWKNRKPVYEYNEEKSKLLEKELAKYYLYKVDFVEQ